MAPALLSRAIDPFLGIFTGVFAYYLYETHPRTALPLRERLPNLIEWKWSKYQHNKRRYMEALEGPSSGWPVSLEDHTTTTTASKPLR